MVLVDSEHETTQTFSFKTVPTESDDMEQIGDTVQLQEVICYSEPSQKLDSSNSYASLASSVDVCRICHCESEHGAPLISPCACSGTLKYVHQSCLQQWIKSANTKSCELCKLDFQMTTSFKPLCKWQKLEMTKVERRKIVCSVTFHVIAITCVVWSLYVLIDRTTEEISTGILHWPFWTKLIVVAIGFTGGLVFMYVQCKMYIQLCQRWHAYNRIIYVQDCPATCVRKSQQTAFRSSNAQKSDVQKEPQEMRLL